MTLSVVKIDPIDPHLQLLGSLFLALRKIRHHGLMEIESDIDNPRESEVFIAIAGYDEANEVVYTFVRDVLRLMVGGNLNPEENARYMEAYIRTSELTEVQSSMFEVARLTLRAATEGYAPQIAVEFGRQGIPARTKPGFEDMEDFMREVLNRPDRTDADVVARLNVFYDGIGGA